jgi:hypothetical protein
MLAELEQAELEDQLAQRRRRLGMVTESPVPMSPPATSEETPHEPAEPEPSQPADELDEAEPEPSQPADEPDEAEPPASPPADHPDEPGLPSVKDKVEGGKEPPSAPDVPGTSQEADT